MALKQISCAFHQSKNLENRLRFDKVTESLKVGTFIRHSVYHSTVFRLHTWNIYFNDPSACVCSLYTWFCEWL